MTFKDFNFAKCDFDTQSYNLRLNQKFLVTIFKFDFQLNSVVNLNSYEIIFDYMDSSV